MSLDLLKKSLKQEKLVYGFRSTLKNLKNGKVSRIFLAKNCPDNLKNKLNLYNVELVELKEQNKEIALICKKKFSVNILSSLKK